MNKKRGQTTKGEATRNRILDAAAECLASHGIEKTTVQVIARQLKTSPGLITFYFPRKDDIFPAVIARIVDISRSSILTLPPGIPPEEKLVLQVRYNFEYFQTHPTHMSCLLLFFYYSAIRDDLRAMCTSVLSGAPARFETLLREAFPDMARIGLRPDALAASIHSETMAALQKFFILHHRHLPGDYIQEVETALRMRLRLIRAHLERGGGSLGEPNTPKGIL